MSTKRAEVTPATAVKMSIPTAAKEGHFFLQCNTKEEKSIGSNVVLDPIDPNCMKKQTLNPIEMVDLASTSNYLTM